jgi:acetyltransferase-like isoleucine patch superfamily enzyme
VSERPTDGQRFAFRACGVDVTIYEFVRILAPERISVGSHVIVDDFVFIDGGEGTEIGSHVHVASFVSITGGGRLVLGDFCGIASGSRVVTGSDVFDGSGLTGPTIPSAYRAVERSSITIGRHAVLGSNVVVHPGVSVGDGAIVGSGAVVTRDLPEWTICLGAPARPVRERPRERMLEFEARLRQDEATG